jgi:hypothetical protein
MGFADALAAKQSRRASVASAGINGHYSSLARQGVDNAHHRQINGFVRAGKNMPRTGATAEQNQFADTCTNGINGYFITL